MISVLFKKGAQMVEIRIIGKSLYFADVSRGQHFATFYPIDYLKLDYQGIITEFPDLKDKPIEEARTIAISRLKEYLKKFKTEKEICDYCIEELKKIGYTPVLMQKDGFRPVLLDKNEK